MPRIYFDADGQLCWADLSKAEAYAGGTRWNGETLYRTAGGRWLLNRDDAYRYLTDDEARDWLIRTEEHEDAIERHFGTPEEERGPGRPAIGAQVKIAIDPEMLAAVDVAAGSAGVTRSEWVRRAIAATL